MDLLTCNDTDRLWKVDDVAGYLGVTPRTVYRLINQDDLPMIKIKGSTRFRKAEIDLWIEQGRAA